MALRLAGEEFSVVKGLDDLGWLREISGNSPTLTITQLSGVEGLKIVSGSNELKLDAGDRRIADRDASAWIKFHSTRVRLWASSHIDVEQKIKNTSSSNNGRVYIDDDFQVTGDIWGVGGFKNSYCFMQSDVAASQTDVALDVLGLSGNSEIVMPYAGSVLGIGIASNTARTGGTLTVDATVNGTKTGLQATLDATNTQYHYTTQNKDTDSFSAGDRLGVKITTDGSWAPTTADIVVTLVIEF